MVLMGSRDRCEMALMIGMFIFTSNLFVGPFALPQLFGLLLGLAPLRQVAWAFSLAVLKQLQVYALALFSQDHSILDFFFSLRHRLLLELDFERGTHEVSQEGEAVSWKSFNSVESAFEQWWFYSFQLLWQLSQTFSEHAFRVTKIDVNHIVFIFCDFFNYSCSVVDIIRTEFAAVESAHFYCSDWFWILRYIWFFCSFSL